MAASVEDTSGAKLGGYSSPAEPRMPVRTVMRRTKLRARKTERAEV